MTFSQGWDAGFKAVMIFAGIVFLWLGLIEPQFANRSTSVTLMTVFAALCSIVFFAVIWRRCLIERRTADAEIRVLQAEDTP